MVNLPKIVGVMGLPCAGKTIFTDMVIANLSNYGLKLNIYRCKMSDWIYKKLKCLDLEVTKENMIWLSNVLINKFGRKYLSNIVYRDIVSIQKEYDIIFIETGYAFEELKLLKEKLNNMIIVCIVADESCLKQRVFKRENEPEKTLMVIKSLKHKINFYINHCDYVVNNSGDLKELNEDVKQFIKKIL